MKPDTVVISIGRFDRFGHELGLHDWQAFINKVREAGCRYGTPVFEGEGEGMWKGESEVAFTFVFSAPNPERMAGLRLYLTLANLATEYRQDCIALTYGTVEFVASNRRREEIRT